MKCPFCGDVCSHVIDSRPANDASSIRRRRACGKCGGRFTTYETIETQPIIVVKKSGSRQHFDRNKLISSMLHACEKRSVSLSALDAAADSIERALHDEQGGEVSSERIGELAMARLKSIDEVAYVRFASVYRRFKDIDTFLRELNKLLEESKTKEDSDSEDEASAKRERKPKKG